jgi:hypothetical protein
MRIERPHLMDIAEIATRVRENSTGGKPDAHDTVSMQFAAALDRVLSIDAASYDPSPTDVAQALIEKGFDR